MIWVKVESKAFEELNNQLCMFKKNFLKNTAEGKSKKIKEALAEKVNAGKFTPIVGGKGKYYINKARENDQ